MFVVNRYINRGLSIQYEFQERLEERKNDHQWRLIFISEGKGEVELNGITYPLRKGTILCLNDKDSYSWIKENEVVAQSFCFHPGFLTGGHDNNGRDMIKYTNHYQDIFVDRECYKGVFESKESDYERIRDTFLLIGGEILAQSDALWVSHVKGLLFLILDRIVSHLLKIEEVITGVKAYMDAHYQERILLETLTSYTAMNRNVLNRQFKFYYHYTVIEYLLHRRLAVVEDLLTYSALSLVDIARYSGFQYDTYMIKQFIQKIGMTPSEYRKFSRQMGETLGRDIMINSLPESEEEPLESDR